MNDKFRTEETGVQSLPTSCEVQYRLQQYFISGTVSYPPECSHLCMKNIAHCIYNFLSEDEPKRFETCRRQQKLKIKY